MKTIGKNISILYRQFNLFMNRELANEDITATELMYLGSLYGKDGITQDDLVREYCIDKAATARTLHGLEKKGLITRKQGTTDKRAKVIYLTEKAADYRNLTYEIQNKWIYEINAELSDEQLNHFVEVLDIITEKAKQLNHEQEDTDNEK